MKVLTLKSGEKLGSAQKVLLICVGIDFEGYKLERSKKTREKVRESIRLFRGWREERKVV